MNQPQSKSNQLVRRINLLSQKYLREGRTINDFERRRLQQEANKLPDEFDRMIISGMLAATAHNRSEAIAWQVKIRQNFALSQDLLLNEAVTYSKIMECDRSLATYREAVELFPKNPAVLQNAFDQSARNGDFELGLEVFELAQKAGIELEQEGNSYSLLVHMRDSGFTVDQLRSVMRVADELCWELEVYPVLYKLRIGATDWDSPSEIRPFVKRPVFVHPKEKVWAWEDKLDEALAQGNWADGLLDFVIYLPAWLDDQD